MVVAIQSPKSKVIEVLEEEEDKKASQGKRKLLKKKVDAAAKSLISAKDLTEESGYEVEGIQEKIDEIKASVKSIEDYINQ